MAPCIEHALVNFPSGKVFVNPFKQHFFPGFHYLVGTGVVHVGMFYELLLLQVVIQIGIWQRFREILHDLINALPYIVPAPFCMAVLIVASPNKAFEILRIGSGQQDFMLHNIIPQLWHYVLPFVLNGSEPAKMVQAIVIVYNILFVHFQRSRNYVNDGNGHVADIDNPCVGAQLPAGFRYDRSRVGVV